jgi:hypothetical protein
MLSNPRCKPVALIIAVALMVAALAYIALNRSHEVTPSAPLHDPRLRCLKSLHVTHTELGRKCNGAGEMKKKVLERLSAPFYPSSLDSLNVLSLPALGAFSDIELHCLAFL